MGRGIAYAAARGGYRTLLHDASAEALARALSQIARDLEEGVARGKVTPEGAAAARARLMPQGTLDDAARAADFVIEAVPEDLALKQRVFARLDTLARAQGGLCSNPSP